MPISCYSSPRFQLLGRPIRIDHVEKYRLPKKLLEAEEEKGAPDVGAGHAYKEAELLNEFNIHKGQDLFAPINRSNEESLSSNARDSKGKEKYRKKKESRRKSDIKKGSKRDRGHDDDSDKSRDSGSGDRRKKRKKKEKGTRKDKKGRHADK